MSDTNSNAVINAWHFTAGDLLRDGTPVPPVGEWLVYEGPIVDYEEGLHASRRLLDALNNTTGSTVHRVECRAVFREIYEGLVPCEERRIIASADIRDLLQDFARFSAWTVLPLWDAPKVVKQWIETGDETIRDAAAAAARDAADAAYTGVASARYAAARTAIGSMTRIAGNPTYPASAYRAAAIAADGDTYRSAIAVFDALLTDAVLARLGLEE